jgi:DNA-binding transcriptional MerR regulator
VRYYERRGLLPEPPRTPNGQRRYDEETVRFLRAVEQAQGLGFTLAETEEYLRLSRGGAGRGSQEFHEGHVPRWDRARHHLVPHL